jgi:hypothetical protein
MSWNIDDYQEEAIKHLRELDTRHMLETDPPAVEWLINGICARGLLSLFVGREKTGKSMMALAFACRMAAGGGFVASIECAPGKVLIVDAENSEDEIHRRLHAMGLGVGHADSLVIAEARGFDLRRNLYELEQLVDRHQPKLVILDAFRSLWSGKEVESDETALALDPLRTLLHDKNVGGLLNHHSRKIDDEYRGNTGVGASVENIVTLSKITDDEERQRRKLSNPSCRFAGGFAPMWLKIEADSGSLSIEPAEPFVPTRDPLPRELLEQDLIAHITRCQPATSLKENGSGNPGFSLSELADAVGRAPTNGTLRRALADLVEDGLLVRGADKHYRPTRQMLDEQEGEG